MFLNPVLDLHTTHSWDFIEKELVTTSSYSRKQDTSGADVIIGLLDSGIIWHSGFSFIEKSSIDSLNWSRVFLIMQLQ